MISYIIIFLLFLLCIVLFYKLYQYSLIILKIEESIEECLDILNERYNSVSKILEKEVFFDSIEVRQVINDIKISQEAIYNVAWKLTGDNLLNEKENAED